MYGQQTLHCHGQTMIQPMTQKFFWLIPSFASKETLFLKAFKYFLRVLQSSSTQKALQYLSLNFNSI